MAGNRLARETSPYLLQHADNPVDWYPWDEEALALARREDRPILLSIGYSACHWCHVMAHECFEDPAIAAVMNALFVNVKVDREERPDLDKVYQLAHQILVRRPGGWPLTMFLAPADLVPFFGGTYFPPRPRHGLPAFPELLRRIAAAYAERREDIAAQNAELARIFGSLAPSAADADADASLGAGPASGLREARLALDEAYDEVNGGWGTAPKFPHPTNLEVLLRAWHADPADERARSMALHTLDRMAAGGLYDHLGGGFARYSTDARWIIPHFEKMLYDNGPLLALYAQAARVADSSWFAQVAAETARWAMREMQSERGGFWSTLDADSEGEEGRFYVWDRDEVRAALTSEEHAVFAPSYGLEAPANFEGRWHLYLAEPLDAAAARAGIEPDAAQLLLERARGKLLARRGARIRPSCDDKVLAGWNGLMIRGLAIAGRLLGLPECICAASRAAAFVREHMWHEGELHATHQGGRPRFVGYLDDHAFLLDGLLELLQARWDTDDLRFALMLADALVERFEDRNDGGFWFTAHGRWVPLARTKPLADEATPSGNGVAALALTRLGYLLAEPRYLEAAERTLRLAGPAMRRAPAAHASLVIAADEYADPGDVVILRADEAEAAPWRAALDAAYGPKRMLFVIPRDAPDLPTALADKAARQVPVAYVCRGTSCSAPLESIEELARP